MFYSWIMLTHRQCNIGSNSGTVFIPEPPTENCPHDPSHDLQITYVLNLGQIISQSCWINM